MDTRRQSGLWKNGIPQQKETPPTSPQQPGPYQYYRPPATGNRRSFAQRTTDSDESPLDFLASSSPRTPPNNKVSGERNQDQVQSASRALNEQTSLPAHATLGQDDPAALSALLAQTKHIASVPAPDESPLPLAAAAPPHEQQDQDHEDEDEGAASSPAASRTGSEFVPDNLRAKAWSPEPMSPRTNGASGALPGQHAPPPSQQRRASKPANETLITEGIRRASVPDRSPLQTLESWSKEEKRARLEEAESRARQKSMSGSRHDEPRSPDTAAYGHGVKDRVVSEGAARRPSRRDNEQGRLRQVSEGANESVRDSVRRQIASPQDISSPKQRRAQLDDGEARGATELGRNRSSASRHNSLGYAAAAAMASPGYDAVAAERGKAAYERRKTQMSGYSPSMPSPSLPATPKEPPSQQQSQIPQTRPSEEYQSLSSGKHLLQKDRVGRDGSKKERQAADAHQQPDPVPEEQVLNKRNTSVKYAVPPQTAAAQQAREQVGFDTGAQPEDPLAGKPKHHRFNDFLHHTRTEHRSYNETTQPLEEWRKARSARLTADDLNFEQTLARAASRASTADAKGKRDATWWEKEYRRSTSGAEPMPDLSQHSGPYEEQANGFQPRLFLKCGPLLRYTGLRNENAPSDKDARNSSTPLSKEIWRGSVMIVTQDDRSDLSRTPVLRLFAQPSALHELPPHHLNKRGQALSPEYEDPVAGQAKVSRTGRVLYVRPVHDIEHGVDLSREESNQGLFAATRASTLAPQSSTGLDGRQSQNSTFQHKNRVKGRDGEKANMYREVKAVRLHTEHGCTFWRFTIEVELTDQQQRIAYRINKSPAVGFWVPSRGESMNVMFHSCNGFSLSVNPDTFSGPDPLWRDVLNRHQSRPFHVMIGGGDQIYNDAAMRDTTLFREWLNIKNPEHKYGADFSSEMQHELENFYFDRYSMWFSQGLFGMANAQIPMLNIWDDHDIIDGFGSYPSHFMKTRVFTGLGAVAYKYYMLFQHQSLAAETGKDEPSWLLGKEPGPYINQVSRSVFVKLGRTVAFLGLDCRTERRRDEILCQDTYDIIFNRCRAEIVKGETRHLIVLLGVPIAYPRLNFLENILTSRVMDPIKAMGRAGMLGGFINKFDGGVEILDDLDDHWTAKHHKAERNWFVQELQELAAEKSVRITILGGDVHLGAVGQFYTAKKLGVRKDKDHRYMPNVVSSAIVNTPPPSMMADVLNRRNKVHHLDDETDEDLIPMFDRDVDGTKRNNKHLLPRRNYCMIREWVPGSTPPPSPRLDASLRSATDVGPGGSLANNELQDRRFPPGSMKRSMSLSGVPQLMRRLSGSSRKRPTLTSTQSNSPYGQQQTLQRASSFGGPTSDDRNPSFQAGDDERPKFMRRPTNLSEKEIRKAAAHGGAAEGAHDGHIDLQGGLDISLCMEVDQQDPAGTTVPYRLLVPALQYEGPADTNTAKFQSHRKSLMDRLKGFRTREAPQQASNQHHDGESFYGDSLYQSQAVRSRSPSPVPQSATNGNATAAAAGLGLSNTGRGAAQSNLRTDYDDGYDDVSDEGEADVRQSAAAQPETMRAGRQTSVRSQNPSQSNNGQTAYPQSGYRRVKTPASRGAGVQPRDDDAHAPQNTMSGRITSPRDLDGYAEYDDSVRSDDEQYDDEYDDEPQQRQQVPRQPNNAAAQRSYDGADDDDATLDSRVGNGGERRIASGSSGGTVGFFRKLSLRQGGRRSTDDGQRPPSVGGLSRDDSVKKKPWRIFAKS